MKSRKFIMKTQENIIILGSIDVCFTFDHHDDVSAGQIGHKEFYFCCNNVDCHAPLNQEHKFDVVAFDCCWLVLVVAGLFVVNIDYFVWN